MRFGARAANGYPVPVIRVFTSHRTEELLDAFARNFDLERASAGAFAPVRVVVPSNAMATYLRLAVAERRGIAANIETTFLRRFLIGVAEQAVPGARVADAAHVEGHLLALLHDPTFLADASLEPVRGYLVAAGEDRDAIDRRRCQLAANLAQLFEEYAGSRHDLLAAWGDGTGADESDLVAWQARLWRAIVGPNGRLRARTDGVRYAPLEILLAETVASGNAPLAGKTVHLFGLSHIAPGFQRMLGVLARTATIFVYAPSPCQEETQDLLAPARKGDDPFRLAEEPQLALRMWGRPARESLRLWARAPSGIDSENREGATLEPRFPVQPPRHLLARVQADIVQRRSLASKAGTCALDASLRILPCPSLRREVEVVAAEIWTLLREDPSLCLRDIAVLVPESVKDAYFAQIPAVFSASHDLPHAIVDAPAEGGLRVAEAIRLLIHLPFSSFTRKELLPLLTHPCVLARFPTATPEGWRALADQLGIVRGADRGDFDAAYLSQDLFTWDQGLRRLALGAFADIEASKQAEQAEPVALGENAYLPGPVIDGDDEAALGFLALSRSLVADARFASARGPKPQRPLSAWLDFIRGMIETYLVLDEDDGAGKAMRAHALAALDEIADNGLGDDPVSYRVAAELAERALRNPPAGRGHVLTSGVTVAALGPLQAIPFRAVFMLGLGQGRFPSSGGLGELDLRRNGRRAGDVDPRERDLSLFLDALLAARDHVTFSYVARDEITGDELPASPALLELRSLLGQGYLEEASLRELFRDDPKSRPPLRRHDDSDDRRALLPAAEHERRARDMGVTLGPPRPESIRSRVRRAPRNLVEPLARFLGLTTLEDDHARDWPQTLRIPLAMLRRFLDDPLQGSARFRLRMIEEDDARADLEDEPFDTDRLQRAWILRATMTQAILDAQGTPSWACIADRHQRLARAAELRGLLPVGLFRSASARIEENLLRAWTDALPKVLGTGPASCRVFRLLPQGSVPGQVSPGEQGIGFRSAPSFSLTLPGEGGQTIDVAIVGETGLCSSVDPGNASTLSFSTRKPPDGRDVMAKEDVHAFLDYVALVASDDDRPAHQSALFRVNQGAGELRLRGFRALDKRRALDYLARLCADLLAGVPGPDGAWTSVHPYLLPHEAVLASRAKGTSVLDEIENLCQAAADHRAGLSSLHGPVSAVLDRYAPPDTASAHRMIADRFGLFFELTEERPA